MNLPSATTGICLIIGDPVAHSLSPKMHNAGYQAADVDLSMLAARVQTGELASAVRGARALGVRGLAVTMPHKVAIIEHLDTIDPTAAKIGAVNTVVNRAGALIGYNTDWLGIINPLERLTELRNRRIAIIGAGGAAQAAAFGCASRGAQVSIINRTIDKAIALANLVGATPLELSAAMNLGNFDVVVNTTSVGMGDSTNSSPVNTDTLCSGQIVFETIYHPRQTKLLRDATQRGATVIEGLEMFVEQGAAQFELHTGINAPRKTMREAIAL